MKNNKNKLLIPLLLLTLISCGEGNVSIWDNMGGGGIVSSITTSTVNVSSITQGNNSIDSALKVDTIENAINIDLNNVDSLSIEGVKYSSNLLKIEKAGTYALSGTLNGAVEVKGINEEIRIILNNATIKTLDTQAIAPLMFKSHESTRILTVYDGTTNTLSDSVGDTEADGDSAVIQAKKSSLVINGSGILNLNAVGEDATAIKVKQELYIIDSTLNINAVKNGIKADKKLVVENANITVVAGNDGIKNDMEAETQEDANLYASSAEYGYMYIKNTSLNIKSGDDALAANNYLFIENRASDVIDIVTNNGCPNSITESSSDKANGKAIKVGGITLVSGTTETDIPASYEDNYTLILKGGTYNVNSNDDAISSKGNLYIVDGTFNLSTGNDGIHAEYLSSVSGGNITVNKSYEALEGATVDVSGGKLVLHSVDDGINAANKDLKNYAYSINVSGGDIYVEAQGDGVDSNGTILMTGGTLIIDGPTESMNGSLDSDRGILVNGGNLVAVGSKGMVENPGTNSEQCYINLTMSTTQNANTKIEIFDEDNNSIYTHTPAKKYQSVIMSLKEIEIGKTYKIVVGTTEYSASVKSIATQIGTSSGGNRPGPTWPGGR